MASFVCREKWTPGVCSPSRNVESMIRTDLRAAIHFKPEDYSGLENLSASLDLIAGIADNAGMGGDGFGVGDGGEAGTGGDAAPGGETPQGGNDGGGDQAPAGGNNDGSANTAQQAEELEEGDTATNRPAFIGERTFMRVDISRLPRMDEYNQLVARNGELENTPADIKTITYFYSTEPSRIESDVRNEIGTNGGLYRRQVDRAVAAYACDECISNNPDEYAQLISPEVVAVEFRYWDGEEWQTEWDSDEMGGFPVAIEVQMIFDPDREDPNRDENDVNRDELEIQRTVIDLPLSAVPDSDDGG